MAQMDKWLIRLNERFFNKFYRRAKYVVEGFQSYPTVPLEYKGYYYSLINYPAMEKYYQKKAEYQSMEKTALLIQGGVDTFTYETIKLYTKMFESLNVVIILSTWKDEKKELINRIYWLGVEVCLSEKPNNTGRANLNLQITSTVAGLRKAKELGCKYVLKTRTDQRFYNCNVFRDMMNLESLYPVNARCNIKSRIIAVSLDSFKYRLYGVSDMFVFGHIDDMCKYWDVPEDTFTPEDVKGFDDVYVWQHFCSESIIVRNYLNKIGWDYKDTLDDTYDVYRELFCFIDRESVELYWPKYSNQYSRWRWFNNNNLLEEITYFDWIELYRKNDSRFNYENKVFEWKRPIDHPCINQEFECTL